MLYFKILMQTAATIAVLGVVAESDKDSKCRYARVLYGSSVLYLLAICIETAQNYLL